MRIGKPIAERARFWRQEINGAGSLFKNPREMKKLVGCKRLVQGYIRKNNTGSTIKVLKNST